MDALKIGHVVRVGGESLDIVLTTDVREHTHRGKTYHVGQMGSYVTVPGRERTLLGFVTGEHLRDTAVDQVREKIVSVQLLGTIFGERFSRGIVGYPVIGDDVCLAVQEDFDTIFGSVDHVASDDAGEGAAEAEAPRRKTFALGRFALDRTFDVNVLGDEFLGKHVAILGNSGSGKSCTTAKILQEILELPGAQIVLFDLHGEYASAFSDEDDHPDANVAVIGHEDLVVPYWLLKYEELEAMLVDRSKVEVVSNQISFLKEALMRLRGETAQMLGIEKEFSIDTPIYYDLERLKLYGENLNDARFILETNQYAFVKLPLRSMPLEEQEDLITRRRCLFNKGQPEGEVPHALYHGKLHGLLNLLDGRLSDRRYDFLMRPLAQAARSRYFKELLTPKADAVELSSFAGRLLRLLAGQSTPRKNLTIIDLSGIPQDIVNITVAAVSRLLFDYNFWCPPETRQPLLLVYEEAHSYVPRDERGEPFARSAVERIAKEGRKYGVSAMVVTQRPAELSETVLAQCNNMIVLRMSNPDDQAYVQKVVGEQFAGLISMLPCLQPGEGFVVGDSVIMPMRTCIELPTRTPRSGNVPFFGVWSGQEECGMPDVDNVMLHWWKQDRSHLAASRAEEPEPEPEPAMDAPIPEPGPPVRVPLPYGPRLRR